MSDEPAIGDAFGEVMKAALAGRKSSSFPVPAENVVFIDIDKDTGLLAGPGCGKTISEAFVAGTEPQQRCPGN